MADKFENLWLARYPRPIRCIHDNGGEFIGEPFQNLLHTHGILDVHTASYNPQGNSIVERMHQTMGNILRTRLNQTVEMALQAALPYNSPTTEAQANDLMDECLATAMYATRVQTNRTMGISPGEFVYQRDMLHDIPIIADVLSIRNRRQAMIDENLRRENARRRDHNYAVGEQVLVKTVQPDRMEERYRGPYTITRVYTNGTVSIARNAAVIERINIRRIKPYRHSQLPLL